jgi:hypothetical protein
MLWNGKAFHESTNDLGQDIWAGKRQRTFRWKDYLDDRAPRPALEAANPHTFVLHSRQTREDPLGVDICGDGYVKSWKAPSDPFPGISRLASCSSGRSERTKHGPLIKPTRHADIDIYCDYLITRHHLPTFEIPVRYGDMVMNMS